MNALDFLFDFAALMGMSSAITLPTNADNVPDMPIQELSIPKDISTQEAHICFSHEQNLQQETHPQHNHIATQYQLAHETSSCPQHKDMTARAEPENVERQYPRSIEQHHSIQLSGFNSEHTCGHDPEQRCQCNCIQPLTVCPPYGCAPPWETSQVPLQPQRFQHSPEEGLPCECSFGDDCLGQPYHRNYMSSHNNCVRDEYFPIVPQITTALHQSSGMPVGWINDELAAHRDELFQY